MTESGNMLKAAVEAWEEVRAALQGPHKDRLADPSVVDVCLNALKGTIPNFLSWGGVEDFPGKKFWESERARALLGINPEADVGTVVFALEGLALKAEGDRLTARMAELEEKRNAYLRESWRRDRQGKLAGDTCRWGRMKLLETGLETFTAQPPDPSKKSGAREAVSVPAPSTPQGPV